MIGARLVEARKRVGSRLVEGFFRYGARMLSLHPRAKPELHGVEVLKNLPYVPGAGEEHHLDVYRPVERSAPLPVVLYVHGGGFRILSKDSHFIMGLAFAKRGFVVFNINYRLAPRHRYPAALEDCATALAWVVENAAAYGGDASRLVLAGESAGANLVTAMSVAASWPREEPFARRIHDLGVVPRATLPACGILQVTDVERFARRRKLPKFIEDRLLEVSSAYLPTDPTAPVPLADPLLLLEGAAPPARPLGPFFIPCGTKDPLLDDSRRLSRALDRLGVRNEAPVYEGELHAFHAMTWRPNAKRCWRETYAFLDSLAL